MIVIVGKRGQQGKWTEAWSRNESCSPDASSVKIKTSVCVNVRCYFAAAAAADYGKSSSVSVEAAGGGPFTHTHMHTYTRGFTAKPPKPTHSSKATAHEGEQIHGNDAGQMSVYVWPFLIYINKQHTFERGLRPCDSC